MQQCGVSESLLATWHGDETKRDFLSRLFPKLHESDAGQQVVVKIAYYLMEQTTFPDLKGWEDSSNMIQDAYTAVERLKAFYREQKEQIEKEISQEESQKLLREYQKKIAESQQSLEKLNEGLNNLSKELGTQGAGYKFQDWFYDLMRFCEIIHRKPYVQDGRQIDGSITVKDTTYLVELKFTRPQAGAPDIDIFRGKVETKADNTMGIMVSISGYSSVAINAASGNKTPLLLFDHGHLYLCLTGIMSFGDVIDRLKRNASQTGRAYLNASEFGS
ncbi:restriction endonuclease [Anabaena sp. UHCC 0187]|uniref:restriction endonuclease n=1 Tax=Anabaena sp. UHCC 0187 TaxID=2590018 RepID=UPI001C2B966B|nr:restriction endonuclease [Anabaena sp. UHCC 0187]